MVRSVFTLLTLAGLASADDIDRDRKARAALALAGAKPAAVARAPMPRLAPKSYSDGYRVATVDQKPLVVFVGCEAVPVPGAIVAKADSLGDVTGPAVVVGFPAGGKVLIDATLKGTPKPEDVLAAVKTAAKKIDLTPARPLPAAPKPLLWDL